MKTIYLLRHCETASFPKKRCIGITDIPLSENGIQQARLLKDYFADKNIGGILCSDASRAVKTAEILSDGQISVTKLAELHEINMGDWDGMYFDDIKSNYPEEYKQRGLNFASFSPPDGESFADCQKRAETIFHFILNNFGENIAVVAHAGFNRALISSLCKADLNELFQIPQPFGCVNILSVQGDTCTVEQTGIQIT
jgi:probable phosphoglycerate mutase